MTKLVVEVFEISSVRCQVASRLQLLRWRSLCLSPKTPRTDRNCCSLYSEALFMVWPWKEMRMSGHCSNDTLTLAAVKWRNILHAGVEWMYRWRDCRGTSLKLAIQNLSRVPQVCVHAWVCVCLKGSADWKEDNGDQDNRKHKVLLSTNTSLFIFSAQRSPRLYLSFIHLLKDGFTAVVLEIFP